MTTTMTAVLPRVDMDQDQLSRLVAVYREVGLTLHAATQAAVADLSALYSTKTAPDHDGGGTQTPPPAWLVLSAFAAIYLIWGSTFLAIRYAVASLPPLLMGGARFGVAGLLLYAFTRLRGEPAPTARQWRDATIIGACMLLIGNGGVTWSEVYIPSGVAALVIALIPFWMVIFDWLRPGGARPRPMVFAGLALGFAGVVVLVQGTNAHGSRYYGWGVAALVVASMSWAIGSLFSRRAQRPSTPLMAVAIQMIAGGALMLSFGLSIGEGSRFSLAQITPVSGAAWVYLCVAGSMVGYTAYVWLLQVSTPARVSTYAYVNPLIAVFLGCTIGHEPLSQGLLLAAGLIVAAVGLIVRGGVGRRS